MTDLTTSFPTWNAYTNAFQSSLNSVDYKIEFAEYAKISDEIQNSDMYIVKELLKNNYNSQEGFELFIEACFNGTRYLDDFDKFGGLQQIVDDFVNHGAKVTQPMIDKIFTVECHPSDHFEDVCNTITPKMIILDVVGKYTTLPTDEINQWKNVTATYWEEIPDDVDTTMKHKMYSKYCSKYLQSL